MEEIAKVTPAQLPEAIDFANRQFGLNFRALQPKIYCWPEAADSYALFRDGSIAGMVTVYEIRWKDLRCLSVGTVCTDEQYRGQGIMQKLFAWLEEHVFPAFHLIVLMGKRDRYEHFGFAKAVWYPSYSFYPRGRQTNLALREATEKDGELLAEIWSRFGNGIERSRERMYAILNSAGNRPYLLRQGNQIGYASVHLRKRMVTEYCGPWEGQQLVNALAQVLGPGKTDILGAWNRHDPAMLRACDSYSLANHCNIRIQPAGWKYLTGEDGTPTLSRLYDVFGFGGREANMHLPSSLFYMDGI